MFKDAPCGYICSTISRGNVAGKNFILFTGKVIYHMKTNEPRKYRKQIAATLLMLLFLFSAGTVKAAETDSRAAGASSFALLLSLIHISEPTRPY